MKFNNAVVALKLFPIPLWPRRGSGLFRFSAGLAAQDFREQLIHDGAFLSENTAGNLPSTLGVKAHDDSIGSRAQSRVAGESRLQLFDVSPLSFQTTQRLAQLSPGFRSQAADESRHLRIEFDPNLY